MKSAMLLVLLASPLASQGTVTKVPFTESRGTIRAFSPTGEVVLPTVQRHLDIRYPRGRAETGALLVVFDPLTENYFWRYRPFMSPGDQTLTPFSGLLAGVEAFYVDAESFADFGKSESLRVSEHRGHAGNLDAAEAASLSEITHDLPLNERRRYHDMAKEVILPASLVPLDFECEPDRSDCFVKAKFISIRRTESGWRLVMRKRWDQEVILGSKFEFLSTRKVGEAPPKG